MRSEPPIAIEPLSERRWAEIRRSVLADASALPRSGSGEPSSWVPSARARLRRWQGATGAAVAVALVLAWIAGTDTATRERLATSRIVTEAAGATASAGDITLEVAPFSSLMVLQRDEHEWWVALEHGSARFLVPPRGDLPPFRVEAGDTRVVVVGTRFVVTRLPGAGSGTVAVEHGAVRVTERDEEIVLREGEQWPTRAPDEASDEVPVRDAIDETDQAAPDTARRAATGGRATRGRAPPSDAPGEDRVATSGATHPAARARTESDPAPLRASARERFAAAASIESSDPEGASLAYEVLAREGGPWAAPASFARARLELERHHDADARRLLERYLTEYPEGLNAEDARRLLESTR